MSFLPALLPGFALLLSPPLPPPSLIGLHPSTVLPLSTSTVHFLPLIFMPSASLYASFISLEEENSTNA